MPIDFFNRVDWALIERESIAQYRTIPTGRTPNMPGPCNCEDCVELRRWREQEGVADVPDNNLGDLANRVPTGRAPIPRSNPRTTNSAFYPEHHSYLQRNCMYDPSQEKWFDEVLCMAEATTEKKLQDLTVGEFIHATRRVICQRILNRSEMTWGEYMDIECMCQWLRTTESRYARVT